IVVPGVERITVRREMGPIDPPVVGGRDRVLGLVLIRDELARSHEDVAAERPVAIVHELHHSSAPCESLCLRERAFLTHAPAYDFERQSRKVSRTTRQLRCLANAELPQRELWGAREAQSSGQPRPGLVA